MELVIILALILLNGLLSMSEIALVSARKTKLGSDAKKGKKAAKAALKLSEEPDRFLATIQIGITLIGILTGLYSGETLAGGLAHVLEGVPALKPYAPAIAKTFIVIVVTYLTLILGELVPKRIGLSDPERVSQLVACPMLLLSQCASPFVWLLAKSTWLTVKLLGLDREKSSNVTEEEIREIVKEGCRSGEVQEVEQDIVGRVFTLGDRSVDSIMTHRSELVWLDVTDNVSQIKEKVKNNPFGIYPVSSGKPDAICGVVRLKDLFLAIDQPDFSLGNVVQEAHFIPENQSVYATLKQFKDTRMKYAIVADEFGEVQGVVTLMDILEGLVGQVPDAGEEQDVVKRADGTWLFSGQYPFYDFLAHFDREDLYADHDYNTISGLILEVLNHLPKTGEKLKWMDFELEIVDMDGARIDKVLVSLQPNNNGSVRKPCGDYSVDLPLTDH